MNLGLYNPFRSSDFSSFIFCIFRTINNATSWNLVSNMLYLDSPAGSNDPIGFSTCNENGKLATICSWNDVTQAEAYASTLLAFYKSFPEYATNELYLTGESYAG